MSLIKQLWLTIGLVLLLAFGGSLMIGLTATRHYIQQEVRIKNADNANALALSMTQLDKDPVLMELLLAAQFDTGHYRAIRLENPAGETILQRQADEQIDDLPGWFVALVRFEVPPGRAVVQDGWRQYGTLTLVSQHSYAYRTLWRRGLQLTAWFLLAGLLSALLAWWIVRGIRRPLQATVTQAREIGERRFTTRPEPRPRELREVTAAMNRLSTRVREMLTEEGEKLDRLHHRLRLDPLTRVANREHFMQRLQASLESERREAHGCLALVRVGDLTAYNERLGHARIDTLLAELGQALTRLADGEEGSFCGRLNGSDFALLLPWEDDPRALASRLAAALHPLADAAETIPLPLAVARLTPDTRRAELLSRLDAGLAEAEALGPREQVVDSGEAPPPLFTTHDQWRQALAQAFDDGVYLAHYPVLTPEGELLHHECPSRLRLRGHWRGPELFMPWVRRLALQPRLDLAVVTQALREIDRDGLPRGIHLSLEGIGDSHLIQRLQRLLTTHPDAGPALWLELPQVAVQHRLDRVRDLCQALRPHGCRIGLEHAGAGLARLADLQDLGLGYIKLDVSLVAAIEASQERQAMVRGMVALCRSLGILSIAEGVTTHRERDTLIEIGVHGLTGPGIRDPRHNLEDDSDDD
ncbi:LapD/MoxY N-terminal periplasmic domain-containing protein [Halomonas pacifica]|uniref:EAL domain-containing protein n=1 Tax=Bisbaumannia pacifica TaxID=77098 RepID=UPI00235901EA|nr:EAL domain-containing protein [Halomonas pacifica]MDC8805542.1 LapD/MoxY N-terminal periplasmic domain-containing protein [Halomonas pacifica]